MANTRLKATTASYKGMQATLLIWAVETLYLSGSYVDPGCIRSFSNTLLAKKYSLHSQKSNLLQGLSCKLTSGAAGMGMNLRTQLPV